MKRKQDRPDKASPVETPLEDTTAKRVKGGEASLHPSDHVFRTPVQAVCRTEHVRKSVEQAVQWGCEIVQWQRLSGDEPGCEPKAPGPCVESTQLEGDNEVARLKLNTARQMGCAYAAFCALVCLYRLAFSARWAGALANNVEAMDLNDGQSEVASVLRHALEKACATPHFRWEKSVDVKPVKTGRSSTQPTLSQSEPPGSRDKQKALSPPQAVLSRSFWRAAAHRGRLDARSRIESQVCLVSVSVSRDEPVAEVSQRVKAESAVKGHARGGDQAAPTGQHTRPGSQALAANALDVTTDELLMVPGAGKLLSEQLLAQLEPGPLGNSFAVVVVPRLFSHEEFSGISMQLLSDLPLHIASAVAGGQDEAELACLVCARLGIGALDDTNVDIGLIAKARVHYLLAVVYRQVALLEPPGNALAPHKATDSGRLDNAWQMQPFIDIEAWPSGLQEPAKHAFSRALMQVCTALTQAEVSLVAQDAGIFFSALRDGIRRQRVQVLLESLAELLDTYQLEPHQCFVEVAAKGENSELSLLVSNLWLEQIADIAWPNLHFDAHQVQAEHLLMLAEVIGFRPKCDIFWIAQAGYA